MEVNYDVQLEEGNSFKGREGLWAPHPALGPYEQVFILIQDKLLILFIVEVLLFVLACEKVAARLS